MFIMAKVYMFPEQKKLPANLENRLKEIAKDYMEMVYAIAVFYGVEDSDSPAYMEVMDLVAVAFAEGIVEAIDEMDES